MYSPQKLFSVFNSRKFSTEKPEINQINDKQKTEFFKQFYSEKKLQPEATSAKVAINWKSIFFTIRRDIFAVFATSAFLVVADHYRRRKNEWETEKEELLKKISVLSQQLENTNTTSNTNKPNLPVAPVIVSPPKKDSGSGTHFRL